ncbi:STAS domain-containing protein [bacterium]|nr:STAS domain-containing protein [bacterium]
MELARARVSEESVVVSITGKIDIQTSPELKSEVLDIANADIKSILLDFSGVTFINSSGLGGLINLLKEVKKQDAKLAIVNPSSFIVNLFKLTQLDKVFSIYNNIEEALEQE